MKHVISFKKLRRTNSKLPFLLFIDTFVGVDNRGADCTISKYNSILWALPILRALNIYGRIVGFFEVLKFREWLIFGFFTILFSRMGLPKAHTLQWVVVFFLAGLKWVDGGKGYYCAQQLYLGDCRLRVNVFNA